MDSSVEHFSIRGFTAKMRASDVAKCWPFGVDFSDARREAAKAFLPPITVVKFQWWTDELDLLRSKKVISEEEKNSGKVHENDDKSEIPESVHDPASPGVPLCPSDDRLGVPCFVIGRHYSESMAKRFNGRSASLSPIKEKKRRQESATASSSKSLKSRMPKKRSIVEIFAVSPQVQTMDFDAEEGDRGDSIESDASDPSKVANEEVSNSNKKSKLKCSKGIRCSLKAGTVSIMSKIKKRKFQNLIKKCSHGIIEPSPRRTSHFSRNVNGSTYNMKSSKNILAAVSVHKKRSSLKYASVQKKHKIQTSNFVAQQQNTVSLDRGFFRNRNKAICRQRSSVLRKTGGKILVSSSNSKQLDRHVRFSEEASNNYFGSIGSPKSTCDLFLDGIAISSGNDKLKEGSKELNAMEVNESDEDISGNAVNEVGNQPIVDNNFAAGLHPHNGFFKEKHQYSGNSVFSAHAAAVGDGFHVYYQGENNSRHNFLPNPWYPDIHAVPGECYVPVVSTQSSYFIPRACSDSGKLFNYFRDSPSNVNVNPMSTVPSMKSLTQHTSSIATDPIANQGLPFLPQLMAQTCNAHVMNQQQLCHPSSGEFVGILHSFPESKCRATMFGETCGPEEFSGLPLNSRGELIQLGSTGTGSFNQPKEPTMLTVPCCCPPSFDHSFPVRDSSSLIKNHDGVLQKAQRNHFPMQNYANQSHDLSRPSSKNISCCGHSQYCRFKSERDCAMARDDSQNTIQPTMRLMGKDFTVGKTGKDTQVCEDGKIWTDKEIIAQHNPTSFPIRSQDWVFPPPLERFNDHVSDLASKCSSQTKAPESGFSEPYFHNRVPSYGCSTVGIPISNPHPLVNLSTSASIFNKAHDIQIPFIPCSESLNPNFPAPSFNMRQHLDSPESMYNQGSRPPFDFSAPHPECGDQIHPILFQKSPRCLPSWLLHATEQNEVSIPSRSHQHAGGMLNYSDVSGTNYFASQSSEATYPYDSMDFFSNSRNPYGSSVLPRLVPVPPGSKLTRMSMNCKNRTRMKGKPPCYRDHDRAEQAVLMPSCRSNKRKLCNFPILEEKSDSGGVRLNTRGKFTDNVIQCDSKRNKESKC